MLFHLLTFVSQIALKVQVVKFDISFDVSVDSLEVLELRKILAILYICTKNRRKKKQHLTFREVEDSCWRVLRPRGNYTNHLNSYFKLVVLQSLKKSLNLYIRIQFLITTISIRLKYGYSYFQFIGLSKLCVHWKYLLQNYNSTSPKIKNQYSFTKDCNTANSCAF